MYLQTLTKKIGTRCQKSFNGGVAGEGNLSEQCWVPFKLQQSIVRIELNSIQAIEVVSVVRVVCDRLGSVSIWSSRSFKHFLRRLGRSGRSGRSYGNQAQGRILPGIFEALKAPFFGTVLFGKQSPWGSFSAYSNEMYKARRSRKLVYYYLVMLYYWSLVVLADEFLTVFTWRLLILLLLLYNSPLALVICFC